MINKRKEKYTSPTVEVIEMENESAVMVGSATSKPGNIDNGGQIFGSQSRRSGGYAASNDLEDMINDILTVED